MIHEKKQKQFKKEIQIGGVGKMCTKKFQVKSPHSKIELIKLLTPLPHNQMHVSSVYRNSQVFNLKESADLYTIYNQGGGTDMWEDTWELVHE